MGAHAAPIPPRKRRAFNPKLRLARVEMRVFILWGCSPHAPGNMGCCIPSDALAGIKASHIREESLYMGACAAPMPPRKHRAFNSKFCPSGIKLAHIFCEKAEQNIFFSLLFSCAVRRNLGCNILCCRGRGASSPTKQRLRMKAFLHRFLKGIGSVS